MNIEIRADTLKISGYVTAVERDSRLLDRSKSPDAKTAFVERIKAGTFKKALQSAENTELKYNHSRKIGDTASGTLKLKEDNIGLYAEAEITDSEVIEMARHNRLTGWSFGFSANSDIWETLENGTQRRTIDSLTLYEVSLLSVTPAYIATSIEMRMSEPVPFNDIQHRQIEILKLKSEVFNEFKGIN